MSPTEMAPAQPGENGKLARWCDLATEGLLLALLAWLPLAFGGVLPLSHGLVVGVAAIAALLFAVKVAFAGAPLRWSWTYVPVFGFVLLVGLQALPLPWSVHEALSPTSADLWRDILTYPPLADGLPTSAPLTLYPLGTARDGALLLAGAVLFVVVVHLARDEGRVLRLLGVVAMVGGGAAVLGLFQTLLGAQTIYGLVPVSGKATAGPFVHYGHFAQFLNLAIGAALGLFLLRLSRRTGALQHEAPDVFADLRLPGRAFDWTLLAIVGLALLAIAVSRSRNGLISVAIAGSVVAFVLHRTRVLRGTGWLLALMLAGAFVALLYLGADPVFDRMSTLDDPVDELEGRLVLARDSLALAGRFPVLGIGEGAFEHVFPIFDESMRPGRAQHAENFYLELLCETGAIGSLCFVVFAALVGNAWRRSLRQVTRPVDAALGGLLFGVVAVLFHANTDFGLHVPAVAGLTIVCAALVVGGAAPWRQDGARPALAGRVIAIAVAVGAAVLLALQLPRIVGAHEADHHSRAAWAIEKTELPGAEPEAQPALYRELVAHLDAAVAANPGHADYRLRQAWAHWALAYAEAVQANPDAEKFSDEEMATLRAAATAAQAMAFEARRVAPTFGLYWTLAGQLGETWLKVKQPGAGEWTLRGMKMAPESPEACLAAGRYLLTSDDDLSEIWTLEERHAETIEAYARAIAMGMNSSRVLTELVFEHERADVAEAVAGDNPRLLERLLAILAKDDKYEERRAGVRERAIGVLRDGVQESETPDWMIVLLARLLVEVGEDDEAIALFRRYLRSRPDIAHARQQLAEALERGGDYEAARAEARRVLLYSPNHGGAKRLLERLKRR